MVNNLLALEVKPWTFDAAPSMLAAENIIGSRLSNQGRVTSNALSGLRLTEAQGMASALEGYRGGDPSALEDYPDLQADMTEAQARIHKALESMKPDKALLTAEKLTRIRDGVGPVVNMPDGPAKVTKWNSVLDSLLEKGDIDDGLYEKHKDKPSALAIEEVLEAGDTAEQWIAETKAEIDAAKPKSDESLTLAQRFEKAKLIADLTKDLAPEYGATPEELQAAQQRATQIVNEQIFGKGVPTTPPPGGVTRSVVPTPADAPAAPAATGPTVPGEAVTRLKANANNPKALADFDKVFGPGAARAILGQ